jgi:hypothetical protein
MAGDLAYDALMRGNDILTNFAHVGSMNDMTSMLVTAIVKSALVLFAANEIRGLVLAGPVLYAMYEAGGTVMAIWIGFCTLAGIALSVAVPLFFAKNARKLWAAFARQKPAVNT